VAIVEWLRATGLRPFLEPLPDPLRGQFVEAYRERVDRLYPRQADGCRLLGFPRLFIVGTRRGSQGSADR